MADRNASGRAAKLMAPILAMLLMTVGGAPAFEETRYYLSADGVLMPAKKNQAPPDLRYFR